MTFFLSYSTPTASLPYVQSFPSFPSVSVLFLLRKIRHFLEHEYPLSIPKSLIESSKVRFATNQALNRLQSLLIQFLASPVSLLHLKTQPMMIPFLSGDSLSFL